MRKDISWNVFFEKNERFADFINANAFNGKAFVEAKDLSPVDSKVIQTASATGKGNTFYRDGTRKVAFGIHFAIVDLEYQETVNYAMPLTIMHYELAEYERQKRTISREIKEEYQSRETHHSTTMETLTSGEYLYGFKKDNRLNPMVTFILFTGEEWDGAKELKEIFDFGDMPEDIKRFVQNYTINLVNIREWEDTSVFRTDIKQVFDFIKYANDKERLRELIKRDSNFTHLSEDAYDVIEKYGKVTGLNKGNYKNEEGEINMCKAMDDWAKEEREIGLKEGHESGLREGRESGLREGHESGLREGHESGLREGMQEGRLQERRLFIVRMLEKNKSDEEIIEITDCTREQLEEIKMKIFKKQ